MSRNRFSLENGGIPFLLIFVSIIFHQKNLFIIRNFYLILILLTLFIITLLIAKSVRIVKNRFYCYRSSRTNISILFKILKRNNEQKNPYYFILIIFWRIIKIYSRKKPFAQIVSFIHSSILTLCHRIISFKFWESCHFHCYLRRVYFIVSWFTLSVRRIAYDIMVENIMKS